MVDDGKKKFEVVEIKGKEIKCKIIVGGDTKGRRGVNLPGAYERVHARPDCGYLFRGRVGLVEVLSSLSYPSFVQCN